MLFGILITSLAARIMNEALFLSSLLSSVALIKLTPFDFFGVLCLSFLAINW